MGVTRRVSPFVTAILLGACAREKPPAVDTVVASSASTASAPVAISGACPRTGHWGDCQLRARLGGSGLAPHSTTEQVGNLPDLPVKPTFLKIGNSGMAFYVFPDTLARHQAAATLDTLKFIPQTQLQSMRVEATRIENDNLLVLLFSKNEHQRERVADAVTAGPPQP